MCHCPCWRPKYGNGSPARASERRSGPEVRLGLGIGLVCTSLSFRRRRLAAVVARVSWRCRQNYSAVAEYCGNWHETVGGKKPVLSVVPGLFSKVNRIAQV